MAKGFSAGKRSIALLVGALFVLVACTSAHSEPTGGTNASAASTTSSPVEVLGGLSSAEPMSVPRAAHTATRLPDGRVLIAGGFGDEEGSGNSAELFDPTTAEFSPTGSMSTARNSHTATLLRDGRVLITGGYGRDGERLASAELYDPATGEFSPTGSMPSPRADHTATLLRDGKVLVVGGTGAGYSFLASALLYNPMAGTFSPTGSMSVPRESATATSIPGGRVLIAGGHAGRHEAIRIYASAEVYDVATGTFSSVGDMTIERHKHDAVRLRDGRVLIVGGSDERDDAGLYRSVEIFDPRTNSFHATGRLHEGRYKMRGTSVRLADGRLLVCCGADRAELFDPASGAFRRIAGSFGSGPLFAAAVRIGPEELLVTGGYSLAGPATDATWIIQL
jgi:galactose oxidase-like protein/Kelch motif protein